MTVAIKIGHTHYAIAGRKSRPIRGADATAVVEIPYQCPSRAGNVNETIRLPVVVKVSWCRRWRIHQVVTNDIEIDAFRRCKGDIGKLAWTAKRILDIRVCLRAGRAQPITEVAGRILIEIDYLATAAINRKIACAARSEISDASRRPAEQVLWAEIAPACA